MLTRNYVGESKVTYAKNTIAGLSAIMLMGAISTQLKTIRDGKEPKEMNDPKFWGQALAQAFGVGVFGDFLSGNESRFGNNLASEMMGPLFSTTASMGGTVAKIKGNITDGDIDKAAAEGLKLLRDNTVPQFWWGKWALNHMLWFPLMDMVNPGYTDRMEQAERSRKDNPVRYIEGLAPSEKHAW
jgi:hypothetical protein